MDKENEENIALLSPSKASILELKKDLIEEDSQSQPGETGCVEGECRNDDNDDEASSEMKDAAANATNEEFSVSVTGDDPTEADDSDKNAKIEGDDEMKKEHEEEAPDDSTAPQNPGGKLPEPAAAATPSPEASAIHPEDDATTLMESDLPSDLSVSVAVEDRVDNSAPSTTVPSTKKKRVLYDSSEDASDGGDIGDMDLEDSDQEKDDAEEEEDANEELPDAPLPPAEVDNVATDDDASPSARRIMRTRRKPKQSVEEDDTDDEEPKARMFRRSDKNTSKLVLASSPSWDEQDMADDEDRQQLPESVSPSRLKISHKKVASAKQPDEDDLLRSTDYLFLEANKNEVTVADICRALSAEYDCKLSKANKKLVRGHLIDLMKGNVQPQVASSSHKEDGNDDGEDDDSLPDEDEEEDQVSEQGDAEFEHSDFEPAEDSDEEYQTAAKRKKARKSKPTKHSSKQQKELKKPKLKRPSQRKAAKNARLVEAERLRKKRMEELRVRNEEMQITQSKEERERAEAIAAKFETNTDELRLKRLEDRLTLLQLLDKKRIAVIDALESKIEEKEAAVAAASENKEDPREEANPEEEESESSSDEEELDIVGASKAFKPLKPIHTHLPSRALDILQQTRSPQAKKKREELASIPLSTQVPISPTAWFRSNSGIMSPTKSIGARNNLRQALKHKQRKQGNLWLARELGYKNEEEHLKDCNIVAEEKRALVQKLEQARVQANERRLLRERILQQEEGLLPEEEEENSTEQATSEFQDDDEEDEEMQLAREIEQADQNIQIPEERIIESEDCAGGHTDDNFSSEAGAAPVASADSDEANDNDIIPDDDVHEAADFPSENGTPNESPPWQTQEPDPSKGASILAEGDSSSLKEDQDRAEGLQKDVLETSDQDAAAGKGLPRIETETAGKPEGKSDSLAEDSDDDEGEIEFEDDDRPKKDPNRPRNAAWQAMLEKEAAMLKRKKKNKDNLIDDQAEEEEEEEVAGLEDFGFSIKKKKQDDEDEDAYDDKLDEDDLKHVVDDVSDNEGDEEAGEEARKRQERLEEKEQHKAILRRMREGYDGRRGGIAGSGVGARGMHRFDQLVAADNREDAKRLGLLNDDEMDSDDEHEKKDENNDDEEDDEAALLDKMLKDRFLHRSDVDLEENFSEDEDDVEDASDKETGDDSEAEEERIQEKLAKRFAKRARMQRLEEMYADSQEFSQQRLIDEDESMRQELSQMKNGLVRKRSVSSSTRSSNSQEALSNVGQNRSGGSTLGSAFSEKATSSLSIALRASRKVQPRTSFLGGDKAVKAKESGALIHRSVALSHVVFASANRATSLSTTGSNLGESTGKRKRVSAGPASSSLFQKVARKVQ